MTEDDWVAEGSRRLNLPKRGTLRQTSAKTRNLTIAEA
jgi:hypothetical protein